MMRKPFRPRTTRDANGCEHVVEADDLGVVTVTEDIRVVICLSPKKAEKLARDLAAAAEHIRRTK